MATAQVKYNEAVNQESVGGNRNEFYTISCETSPGPLPLLSITWHMFINYWTS
jgi:hypothetical protein